MNARVLIAATAVAVAAAPAAAQHRGLADEAALFRPVSTGPSRSIAPAAPVDTPAGPKSPPHDAPVPEVEGAGEAARRAANSRTALRLAYERLIAHFADPKPLPRIEVLEESEKVKAMLAFLDRLVDSGQSALSDEAAFRQAFERYLSVAVEAAAKFREAAEHFRGKARDARFEENRQTYDQIAEWYEARARRHAVEGGVVLPGDLENERNRMAEMLAVVKEFRSTLRSDPLLLSKEQAVDMRAFKEFYPKLGDALRSWRDQLQGGGGDGDIGPAKGEDGAEVRPAEGGPRPAPGRRVRFTSFLKGLKDEDPEAAIPVGRTAGPGTTADEPAPPPPPDEAATPVPARMDWTFGGWGILIYAVGLVACVLIVLYLFFLGSEAWERAAEKRRRAEEARRAAEERASRAERSGSRLPPRHTHDAEAARR